MVTSKAWVLQVRCMLAVTRRFAQATTSGTPPGHPRATNSPGWRVTTCKQHSTQFSTTIVRHAGDSLPWTEAELEIARKGVRDGFSQRR